MAFDDSTLILRYQMGDNSSLDLLIARHRAKAYKYAYRLTHDPDQACDLVAEAFIRICRSLKNFRGQSAFSTWFHRIITNCFLDMRQKALLRPTMSLEGALTTCGTEVESQIVGTCPSPQMEIERRECGQYLSEAISQLPPGYRTIILLFHADMLSYEEITKTLQLPIGTVKSRLNRARLAMREILAADKDMLMTA